MEHIIEIEDFDSANILLDEKSQVNILIYDILYKNLIMQNVIIDIKSVWNKDQNHYYDNVVIKKCSYQLPKNCDKKNMFLFKLEMLHYGRIGVSEGIDVDKKNESKECDIFHCWYFLDKGFQFQTDVCNEYHDVFMMPMNLSNMAILNINSADCCCIISRIGKSKAVILM